MTKTALLLLLAVGSTACTASAFDPVGHPAASQQGSAKAPAEMIGTWQFTTAQGSAAVWSFEAEGAASHVIAVTSGPSACRRTATSIYEGTVEVIDRTLVFTATSAAETSVDCKGTVRSPGQVYSETLTFEIASPTVLVVREVSKCQQTDQASKDAFCRTTFTKKDGVSS